MDVSKEPQTYQVIANNIGVKPAGCIATLALYKSADMHKDSFPVMSIQLRDNSYVDDLGLTGKAAAELRKRTEEADIILKHAGMKVKRWVYSGDDVGALQIGDVDNGLPLEEVACVERMLGVVWNPKEDVLSSK